LKKALPWPGGKAALAARIVSLLVDHVCYVETCVGGGGVFFAKPRSQVEVLNDRNLDLINLYRVWQRHRQAFMDELGLMLSSRRVYEDFWSQRGLTDIERAVRFYYRVRHTFCAKPAERSFGYGTTKGAVDPARVEADIRAVHERLARVYLEDLSVDQVIDRYDRPHTLFYVDPPYYKVSKVYGPGLDWSPEDHERLAVRLRTVRGAFLLSINDHPDIRRLYGWARVRPIEGRYSLGANASRSKDSGVSRTSHELLITNRPWADGWKE
jgi:DNA adenine methylase